MKKLNEYNLDGYKHILKNEWGFPEQLMNYLRNNGFIFNGSGAFSTIYKSSFVSKNKPFVIKINNGLDKDYLKFVEFCQQNKGNPHLPKMGQIKKLVNEKNGQEWFILFIEKLDRIPYKLFDTKNYFKHITENIDDFTQKDDIIEFMDEEFGEYDTYLEYKKQLLELSLLMIKFTKETGLVVNDLHNHNILFRGNTLVIIDPVA